MRLPPARSADAGHRSACSFMANANNPTGGMDQRGLTAMLNSLLTFPAAHHAGVVQNLRLSRELFEGHRDQAEALIRGYFEAGGTQLMITVTGREELDIPCTVDAQELTPEQRDEILHWLRQTAPVAVRWG